jgi:hypothetical protein
MLVINKGPMASTVQQNISIQLRKARKIAEFYSGIGGQISPRPGNSAQVTELRGS